MNVSVEISMYPLRENYLEHIDSFLEHLHNAKDLQVQTNVMSTQVFGPMDKVFAAVQEGIAKAYANIDHCPFVIKVLNGDVSAMEIKDY